MQKLFENWRRFLITEGGNVFQDQSVGPIPLGYIQPTLEKYYEELSRLFPQHSSLFQTFEPLGSVGKKAKSGDIDLAVDVSDLFPDKKVTDEALQSWNLNPDDWKATYQRFVKRARTVTPEQVELRAFLYELAKYIGENSTLIISDLKKVRPGNMFTLFPQHNEAGEQQDIGVQMDWMLGNKNWLTFSYFSDFPSETQPMLKGLHRTQLVLSMFGAKNYSFNHVEGVFDKSTGQKVAHSPSEALQLLQKIYGAPISREDLLNFNSLYNWIEANTSEQEKANIYDMYLRILDSTNGNKEINPTTGASERCGYIPQELESYWLQNWQRLGLKGRYLCKTINNDLRNAIMQGNQP